MTWTTIRRATETDNDNLSRAAVRFCRRHNIPFEMESDALFEVESLTAITDAGCGYDIQNTARRLRPLWIRIVRRTLGSRNADGISYGYVGFHVD